MEKRAFLFFLAVTLVTFLWISSAASQMNTIANLESIYRAQLDELISKCESQTSWRDSKLEKIRQTASLACLKASFFKYHKEALIEEMMKENVGAKRYKISHYLNSRFFNMLRDVIEFVSINKTKRIS